MNKKIIIWALVVCLLAFVAVFTFSQSSSNVRWEYTTNADQNLASNNELGRQGWEVVALYIALETSYLNVDSHKILL